MSDYPLSEQLGSLIFICVLAGIAGTLVDSLYGFKVPSFGRFKGCTVPALLVKVQIPSLIVMIIMGFVLRNFGGSIVSAYPPEIAGWVENCVLGFILVRGSLSLTFKGKILSIALLVLVP